jgi:hypothetical protein
VSKDEPSGPLTLRLDERLFLETYRLGMNVFFLPVLLALSPVFVQKTPNHPVASTQFQRFPSRFFANVRSREGKSPLGSCPLGRRSSFRCSVDQGTPLPDQTGKALFLGIHPQWVRDSDA